MPKSQMKIAMKAIKDKNIADMFNQMLGAGICNMAICYPKYKEMKDTLTMLVNVIEMFKNSPFMSQYKTECNRAYEDLESFVTMTNKQIGELFTFNFADFKWNLALVPEEDKKAFSERYEQIKQHPLMICALATCDALSQYKKYIGNSNNLSYKFILLSAGAEWSPFKFSPVLNFKQIFCTLEAQQNVDLTRRFLLVVINKVYTLTMRLYKLLSSPDIDIDEFVDVIINNLSQVRKHIPRCDKAFKKIEESVHLLKSNFSGYYRDFIQSKNSTIIMENFVVDVSKNTKADSDTMRQFRTIIQYYRKMAQTGVKDERINMLFEKVDEQYKKLGKYDNIMKEDSHSVEDFNKSEDLVPELFAEVDTTPESSDEEEGTELETVEFGQVKSLLDSIKETTKDEALEAYKMPELEEC